MNNKKIIKYFLAKRSNSYVFFVFLAFAFFAISVFMIDGHFNILDIAFVSLTITFTLLSIIQIKYSSEKYLDNYIDDTCNRYATAKANQFKNRSNTFLDNNTSTSTYSYHGYSFDNSFSTRRSKIGKDGITRSTIYEVSYILLTESDVIIYKDRISLITNESYGKSIEFNIADIISVHTESVFNHTKIVISLSQDRITLCTNNEESTEKFISDIKNKIRKTE
ncbi:MAG: hypothetical protein HFJ99_01100 [Eubacterium sp.]|nr:hypothetical protein [Eubacterium sp.]